MEELFKEIEAAIKEKREAHFTFNSKGVEFILSVKPTETPVKSTWLPPYERPRNPGETEEEFTERTDREIASELARIDKTRGNEAFL